MGSLQKLVFLILCSCILLPADCYSKYEDCENAADRLIQSMASSDKPELVLGRYCFDFLQSDKQPCLLFSIELVTQCDRNVSSWPEVMVEGTGRRYRKAYEECLSRYLPFHMETDYFHIEVKALFQYVRLLPVTVGTPEKGEVQPILADCYEFPREEKQKIVKARKEHIKEYGSDLDPQRNLTESANKPADKKGENGGLLASRQWMRVIAYASCGCVFVIFCIWQCRAVRRGRKRDDEEEDSMASTSVSEFSSREEGIVDSDCDEVVVDQSANTIS